MIAAGLPWPTWQQSLVFALLCTAGWYVVRRRPSSRATVVLLPVLHELAVIGALYTLWRTLKKLPLAQTEFAIERARDIHEFQQAIGLPSELGVNELALNNDWLGWISSAYYAGMHIPGTIAFLIWMFWRHRDSYGPWRTVLALTTAGCIAIRFVRVAPPRFLPDLGFVDVTVIHGMDVYGPVGTGVSGQFVAMPSIHVAWAGVVAFGVIAASPSRWRWVAALHLPITIFVVSATGHHWWLDGIVGLAIVVAAIAIDRTIRRWIARSGRDRGRDGTGDAQAVAQTSTSAPSSPATSERPSASVSRAASPRPSESGVPSPASSAEPSGTNTWT